MFKKKNVLKQINTCRANSQIVFNSIRFMAKSLPPFVTPHTTDNFKSIEPEVPNTGPFFFGLFEAKNGTLNFS